MERPIDTIWEQCRYYHENEAILDMSCDTWCHLSVTEQQSYARQYQQGYAQANSLELEKTVSGVGWCLNNVNNRVKQLCRSLLRNLQNQRCRQ